MQISPGMTHPPSRLYLSDLRHSIPCKFRALTIMAALPHRDASYPLPVRQASALPSASSRFAVTCDTLAVQLTLPLAGRVEDFHLQVSAPCRAQSGRRRGHPRRPPTPPGIRFRTTAVPADRLPGELRPVRCVACAPISTSTTFEISDLSSSVTGIPLRGIFCSIRSENTSDYPLTAGSALQLPVTQPIMASADF
jgi:hypothetical protein